MLRVNLLKSYLLGVWEVVVKNPIERIKFVRAYHKGKLVPRKTLFKIISKMVLTSLATVLLTVVCFPVFFILNLVAILLAPEWFGEKLEDSLE